MLCPKCAREQHDENLFCSACGTRLFEREWTLHGWIFGCILAGLLLCGVLGGWLIFGRKLPVQPQPAVTTKPPPVQPLPKPSAGTPFDAFAPVPAHPYAPTALPAPPAKTADPKPVSPPSPVAVAHLSRPLTAAAPERTFGPLSFRLPAHQQKSFPFNLAGDGASAPDKLLEMDVRSSGGFGEHLRVLLFHDLKKVYDSQNASGARLSVPVGSGNFLLVVRNDAAFFPRDVWLNGKITPLRR